MKIKIKAPRGCTSEEIRNAIDSVQTRVKDRVLLGMFSAPGEKVNLSVVSHVVTALEYDGKEITGEVSILETCAGEMLQIFLDKNLALEWVFEGLRSPLRIASISVNPLESN